MRPGLPTRVFPEVLAALIVLAGCADTVGSPAVATSPSASPARAEFASTPTPSLSTPVTPASVAPASAAPASAEPTPEPTAAPTPPPAVTPKPTPAPALRAGEVAYVAVTVATGWHRPTSPRTVDAPALANPVRIRAWLAGLSNDEQAGLIGRVDTQVLLGDAVLVTELTKTWARVVVPDQATPLDRRGYPAWIPRRQLTAIGPAAAPDAAIATIIVRTAWLETDRGARLVEASFATRLPVVKRTDARVQVALPGGRAAWLPSTSVSIRSPGEPALLPDARSVVAMARQFLGLRYLWGGTSGFGLDCSGLVYLVYRVHGITLPRDAAPQSAVGAAVAPASRAPGDLVFFARNGDVHHIAVWIGGGKLIEAPQVGTPVRVVSLAALPYRRELSVTRRVLE